MATEFSRKLVDMFAFSDPERDATGLLKGAEVFPHSNLVKKSFVLRHSEYQCKESLLERACTNGRFAGARPNTSYR